ncbi:MAG: 2OG-Fe(II) oxygenase family protein [Halioglobus sp.]
MFDKRLPVINFATLHEAKTLRALDNACRTWGAFELVGHPVSQAQRSALSEAMHGFFGKTKKQKNHVARTEANPWGYYDSELTRETQDWKEIYDYGLADGPDKQPQWTDAPTGFEKTLSEHFALCEKMSFDLLGAIAENLGATVTETCAFFRPNHTSFLRLNYYPPCPSPAFPMDDAPATEGFLGVNPHTDAGALTLLLQEQRSGLEIFHQGGWLRISGGALVVNIGDIIQVWSNDRYTAPLHRAAANCQMERFSAPFFFNPKYKTQYQPLPATIDSDHPPRYSAINWGEFRRQRAAGDYSRMGKEIQISQFRI